MIINTGFTMYSRLIFVGNLDSLLFRQRVEFILDLLGPSHCQILHTGRRNITDFFKLLISSLKLFLQIIFLNRSICLVFHGAYSPLLWPLLLLRRVRTVSIIQGSELNIDFVRLRAHLITLILRRSVLIVCRSEVQIDEVVRLCDVKRDRCVIVNWGLNKDIFNRPLAHRSGDPVLISPRATQSEYNIPVIFAAVDKLKKEGHRLHFIYVRFNPTFDLEDTSIADEILEAPPQHVLWEKLAQADLCISVPDYDGLSNTILETLALGSTPLFSDLSPYAFLKQDDRLGVSVALGDSFEQKVERLHLSLQRALSHLGEHRASAGFRRSFAEAHFREGSGVERIVEALHA